MKQIKITNDEFHQRDVRGRTALIAYDTLFLLKTDNAFHAKSGVYGDLNFYAEEDTEIGNIDLKEKLNNIEECSMCAKGFALISKVRLNGPLIMESHNPKYITLDEEYDIRPNLVPDYMDESTYNLLESLFEGADMTAVWEYLGVDIDLILEHWSEYIDDQKFGNLDGDKENKFNLSQLCKNLIFNLGIIDLNKQPTEASKVTWDGDQFVWSDLKIIDLYNY